jgi:hypothetical protein
MKAAALAKQIEAKGIEVVFFNESTRNEDAAVVLTDTKRIHIWRGALVPIRVEGRKFNFLPETTNLEKALRTLNL